jgi:hypothetical protein
LPRVSFILPVIWCTFAFAFALVIRIAVLSKTLGNAACPPPTHLCSPCACLPGPATGRPPEAEGSGEAVRHRNAGGDPSLRQARGRPDPGHHLRGPPWPPPADPDGEHSSGHHRPRGHRTEGHARLPPTGPEANGVLGIPAAPLRR